MATNGSDHQAIMTNSSLAIGVHDSPIFKYTVATVILILALLGMMLSWMYIKVVSADKELIKIFFYKLSVYMCYTDIVQNVVLVVLVWTVTIEEEVKVSRSNIDQLIYIVKKQRKWYLFIETPLSGRFLVVDCMLDKQ